VAGVAAGQQLFEPQNRTLAHQRVFGQVDLLQFLPRDHPLGERRERVVAHYQIPEVGKPHERTVFDGRQLFVATEVYRFQVEVVVEHALFYDGQLRRAGHVDRSQVCQSFERVRFDRHKVVLTHAQVFQPVQVGQLFGGYGRQPVVRQHQPPEHGQSLERVGADVDQRRSGKLEHGQTAEPRETIVVQCSERVQADAHLGQVS